LIIGLNKMLCLKSTPKYKKWISFWSILVNHKYYFFFSTGFYSPYRTLAFLNGLLNPQTFSRSPWLGDQSNTRPLPKHRTTQHRNMQTHIHALSRFGTCNLNVQAVIDSTCLRLLGCWDRQLLLYKVKIQLDF
jgi:hypothetical protein